MIMQLQGTQTDVLRAAILGPLSHWKYIIHGEHHMMAPVSGCLFIALLPILYLLKLQVHETAVLAVRAEIDVIIA